MKLLTLNTHSLIEEDSARKLMEFVSAAAQQRPAIIALQEVNQSTGAPVVTTRLDGYTPCAENVVIRADNYAMRAVQLLRDMGAQYHWTWLPIKLGYGRFDEGVSVLSSSPIVETDVLCVSAHDDYNSHKTRKLVGVRTQALPDEWFFSVHYGRWDDPDEPFRPQWIRTAEYMTKHDCVWLMGDFNAPAEVRGEGYDLMLRSYWHDSYALAQEKDSGPTASAGIDGWQGGHSGGMRIDHIWCSKQVVITDSRTVFNGSFYPVISDHFGVMVNYERSIV